MLNQTVIKQDDCYLDVVEPLADARDGDEALRVGGHGRDDEEGQLDDEHHGVGERA